VLDRNQVGDKKEMTMDTERRDDMTQEHGDRELLQKWHLYASHQPGFIGFVLQEQRIRHTQTQEQQRAQLGILDAAYDPLWVHLQGMPLPRNGAHFHNDVLRIARYVEQQARQQFHLTATIHSGALEAVLTTEEEPA
jgi:hypothetical protein